MTNDNIERDNVQNAGVQGDGVQHGIDDNPHGDAGKGALLGGLGGAAVGALAGGPIGAVIGAVAGALASGAGVAAVDAVDNDNTVSGVGDGVTPAVGSTTNTEYVNNEYANQPSTAERILGTTDTTRHDYATTGLGNDIAALDAGTPNARTTMNTNLNEDLNARATTDLTDRDTIRVPVMEEQLNVEKQAHQAGEVQVHKEVVTEQVNIPVEVSREEVVVTRHAVDRDLAPGETTLGGDEVLRVPVMEETVTVTKTPHVVEEIEIGKTRTTEQQTVSDTVRKERVDIDDSTATTTTDINARRNI